jgi:NADH:ubiquinone oxidoreductase subunit E
MNIQNETLLNSSPGDPNGYVTKDGKWAAVPWGKKFIIICNGEQVHTANNYTLAKEYITKKLKQTPRKRSASSSLEEHLK